MQKHRAEIRRIMIAVNVLDGLYAAVSKKMGIKENTLTLLYALDDGAPHSQSEICREWMIPKTTLNTIVKGCMEAGWVTLVPDAGSRRKRICLTKAGKRHAGRTLRCIYAWEEAAYAEAVGAAPADFVGPLQHFTEVMNRKANQLFEGVEAPWNERNPD